MWRWAILGFLPTSHSNGVTLYLPFRPRSRERRFLQKIDIFAACPQKTTGILESSSIHLTSPNSVSPWRSAPPFAWGSRGVTRNCLIPYSVNTWENLLLMNSPPRSDFRKTMGRLLCAITSQWNILNASTASDLCSRT